MCDVIVLLFPFPHKWKPVERSQEIQDVISHVFALLYTMRRDCCMGHATFSNYTSATMSSTNIYCRSCYLSLLFPFMLLYSVKFQIQIVKNVFRIANVLHVVLCEPGV